MSHVMKNTDYIDLVKWTIYVIMHPSKKEFYIGRTSDKSLRSHYKGHTLLRYRATKNMFEELKTINFLPMMYVLETVTDTKVNAFSHQIIWTKYFMEHGYTPIDPCGIVGYATDLSEENQVRYALIASKPLESLCNPNTCLFADYGKLRRRNEKPETYQINLSLTHEDYETICKNGKEIGMSKTAYCKDMALDKCILNINYTQMENHTEEISQLRTIINDLVRGIVKSGECYEAEIKMIISLHKEILAGEKALLRQYDYNTTTIRRLLRKMSSSIAPKAGDYDM